MNLFDHQRTAVEFAIRNDGKCALFHEPGLGKTRTCLEIYKYYKVHDRNLKLLVVCPLSLINSAWGEDISKFTQFLFSPLKKVTNELPDIITVNYESLISKRNLLRIENMVRKHHFMCVLDESSRLKNNSSVTTKTLLSLASYFKYRIIASGTPMPNSELELWGQVNFIQPHILFKSFYKFRNTYFHLSKNGRTFILPNQHMTRVEMQSVFRKGWKYEITPHNRQKLMNTIKPFTHWVKKSDALDLPDKVDQIREIALNSQEQKAYREMERHLITEIDGTEITAQVALAKLMKLRQATSGFFYSETGEVAQIGNASKIKELSQILEELGGQQVIIWVQFRHEVNSIQQFIEKKYGVQQVVTLYAGTKDREEAINKFRTNQARYLIAHPRSAAHGLTFTNCNTMIFYSLDYSYEAHAQARDRIHRIGQTQSCLYIYITAKNSIDEQLINVLRKKQSLQDIVYAIVRNKTQRKGYPVHKADVPEMLVV